MSRTRNSLRNGIWSVSLQLVNIFLSFVARSVFIHHVGVELLGLNTSVENLLGALNIAELGVGYAIASSLYVPMARGDNKAVADIIALQGWIYRRVACFIIAASVVLMALFPVIFSDADFPLGYAYAAYSAYLFSSLLGFFVNYKMVAIEVSQESYKITIATRLPNALRTILQILALSFTSYGYEIWLALNVLCAIASSALLQRTVQRDHPYLAAHVDVSRSLFHQYPEVGTKVRQLMFQRLSAVAFQRSSPLVLLAFASLADVGIYGNYMQIFLCISTLVECLFNGMQSSVGNLVSSSSRSHSAEVFGEILAMRVIVAAVCAFGFYVCVPSFVTLWVGGDLRLDSLATLLLSIMLFIDISRSAVDSFLHAYGFFSDVWASVIEAVLNVGLSVALGSLWGLHGILVGVLISLVVIILGWKPYYLFRLKLGGGFCAYWRAYAWGLAAAAVFSLVFIALRSALPLSATPVTELVASLCASALFAISLSAFLCVTSRGARRLFERVRGMVVSSKERNPQKHI